jgi:hypothetical protein
MIGREPANTQGSSNGVSGQLMGRQEFIAFNGTKTSIP